MDGVNVRSSPSSSLPVGLSKHLFLKSNGSSRTSLVHFHKRKLKYSNPCYDGFLPFRKKFNDKYLTDTKMASSIATADRNPEEIKSSTNIFKSFWKFLRPHTIRGTIMGSVSVTTRALIEHPETIDWSLLPIAALGVLALLCGNGYIVGINQIYDVKIDQVNKPSLPIASGEMSASLAWILVALLGISGIGLAFQYFGRLIGSLYSAGLILGTLYSIEPFRLKRFPVPAFLIIATVRGFLLNFGVYYATRAALKLKFVWSPAIIFITSFVTIFATVIAITKDLPDIEGDNKFKIRTFATRLGVRNIAFVGSGILMLNYIIAAIVGLKYQNLFNLIPMTMLHGCLALKLFFETFKLDKRNYTSEAITMYYGWIWNLFYLEYCILPFL